MAFHLERDSIIGIACQRNTFMLISSMNLEICGVIITAVTLINLYFFHKYNECCVPKAMII